MSLSPPPPPLPPDEEEEDEEEVEEEEEEEEEAVPFPPGLLEEGFVVVVVAAAAAAGGRPLRFSPPDPFSVEVPVTAGVASSVEAVVETVVAFDNNFLFLEPPPPPPAAAATTAEDDDDDEEVDESLAPERLVPTSGSGLNCFFAAPLPPARIFSFALAAAALPEIVVVASFS